MLNLPQPLCKSGFQKAFSSLFHQKKIFLGSTNLQQYWLEDPVATVLCYFLFQDIVNHNHDPCWISSFPSIGGVLEGLFQLQHNNNLLSENTNMQADKDILTTHNIIQDINPFATITRSRY